MTIRPPSPANPLSVLAAAATPVVAAALVGIALAAGGCQARPPAPSPSSAPSATPAGTAPGALQGRLLVFVGGPAGPRASVRDPRRPDVAGLPLGLPGAPPDDPVVAMAAAPDGRLAAVTAEGLAWIAPAPGDATDQPDWGRLPATVGEAPLPGPVLGAAWSRDGASLALVAGSPGAGDRRTAIIVVPVDGSRPRRVDVPLEADGPAIATLPRGVVAFAGRDLRDRAALARIAPAGTFVTLPTRAHGVAAGGDLVALLDDATVRVGTLAELDGGRLPEAVLPLAAGGGVGAVAIAPDGAAVAVVRLDESGAAARVDVLRRLGLEWVDGGTLALDPADGTAALAWLP